MNGVAEVPKLQLEFADILTTDELPITTWFDDVAIAPFPRHVVFEYVEQFVPYPTHVLLEEKHYITILNYTMK